MRSAQHQTIYSSKYSQPITAAHMCITISIHFPGKAVYFQMSSEQNVNINNGTHKRTLKHQYFMICMIKEIVILQLLMMAQNNVELLQIRGTVPSEEF